METTSSTNRLWPEQVQAEAQRQGGSMINVSPLERSLSLITGGALIGYGLWRRSLGGVALALAGGGLTYIGATGHCAFYQALGINTAAEQRHGRRTSVPAGQGLRVEKTLTINRQPEELYRFWRKFDNLPRVMKHLESIQISDDKRSHWVVKGPLGSKIEWDAEVITERPYEVIGWRSLPGAAVDHAGSVHFERAPGGRGTTVRIILKYDPPGGKIAAGIVWLFGDGAEPLIQQDLENFQRVMEAGQSALRGANIPDGHAQPQTSWQTSDIVGEASEESFPASDAPSWTTGR